MKWRTACFCLQLFPLPITLILLPSPPPPISLPLSLSLSLSLYMMFLRNNSESFFLFSFFGVLQSVELKHTAVVLPAYFVPKGECLCMTTRGGRRGSSRGQT